MKYYFCIFNQYMYLNPNAFYNIALLFSDSLPKPISVANHLTKMDRFSLPPNTILQEVSLAPQYSATINDSGERIS